MKQTWQDRLSKIEKAYGGCKKCYGKGYLTEHEPGIGWGVDFTGDKPGRVPPKIVPKPCTCDRGKQFKFWINKAREEGYEKADREHEEWLEQQAQEEAHRTAEGYCCACEYDMAVMASKIKAAKEEGKKEERERIKELITNGMPRYLKGGEQITQYFAKGYNECKLELVKLINPLNHAKK